MKASNRNRHSARAEFSAWLEGARNGAIYAKMDEIRSMFGADNSMNRACRKFLELCKAELQVREDIAVIDARRRMNGGAA